MDVDRKLVEDSSQHESTPREHKDAPRYVRCKNRHVIKTVFCEENFLAILWSLALGSLWDAWMQRVTDDFTADKITHGKFRAEDEPESHQRS